MTVVIAPGDVVHEYRPRGTQRKLWTNLDEYVLMAGPAGTGKTRACLEYIHDQAMTYPGSRYLLVRSALEWLKASALVTWQEEVIADAEASGLVEPFHGNRFKQAQYAYHNGSVVLVGGMDKPGKVMSAQYDKIYVNEATELTQVQWESLATRKRHGKTPLGQIIADCNPAEDRHWLKLRADAGMIKMYNTSHRENPLYYDDDGNPTRLGREYVEGTLAGLTGMMKERMFYGRWVAAEGVIFTEFDPAVHLIDPFDIPVSGDNAWTLYWTIDFGFQHPFVWQLWAEDFDGRLFMIKEIYMSGRTVEDHCRTIKRVTNGMNRPRMIITDHQRQEREIFEREFAKMRMRTTLAKKDVLPGINAFQQRLKDRRAFFFKNALVERDQKLVMLDLPWCTEQEFPGYVWLDRDKPKEGPDKKKDDGMDAARYLFAQLDLRPTIS